MDVARSLLSGITFTANSYDCATGADALVIATEWEQFRALDLDRLKAVLKTPLIVDLRNIYTPAEMHGHGFRYHSIGRPPVGRKTGS
jgi:UDPglucose 6-dehydrogenase